MWEIEYGADYADLYEIRVRPEDWDGAMSTLSQHLAEMVERRLILPEEFEQGMEWVTGVVVEDHDVRVSAHFGEDYGGLGGLTISLTLTE